MHFTVAVITNPDQSVDDLMAPFDENLVQPDYVMQRTKDEIINEKKKHQNRIINDLFTQRDKDVFTKKLQFACKYDNSIIIANNDEEYIKAYKKYALDPDWTDNHGELMEYIDENGNLQSKYNRNRKYDWYEVGGRWKNKIHTNINQPELVCAISQDQQQSLCKIDEDVELQEQLCRKVDSFTDSALVQDIDFSSDPILYQQNLRFWDIAVNHSEMRPGEEELYGSFFYTPEYYKTMYSSNEDFAERRSKLSSYSVLTPDGTWYSKSDSWSPSAQEERNWDNNYDEFFQNLNPNDRVTIVDYHI